MTDPKKPRSDFEKHLRVYENRSEYFTTESSSDVFHEGVMSHSAKKRIKGIKDSLEAGFLDALIIELKSGRNTPNIDLVSQSAQENLKQLVDMLTSEVGRALIGLTVLQLCIKSICPSQSIRLHKASSNTGSFSWAEGVSMRTLDKNHITPTLRKHDLVRLNADGFMMTRSLAENYPYSSLYKAQLRGAREEWLSIVEELESGRTDPTESLRFLVSLLINAATTFSDAADELLKAVASRAERISEQSEVIKLLSAHAHASDYAARLLEISMHALMQAAVQSGALGDVSLKALSQMRSANKKHGNIGDIELLDGPHIVEAWDAKYGKPYLREEIEEIFEKIKDHEHIAVIGFVTNDEIQRGGDIKQRINELHQLYGVELRILSFPSWVDAIYERCSEGGLISGSELSKKWLIAYSETLAQRRRTIAPIDEPCLEWVRILTGIANDMVRTIPFRILPRAEARPYKNCIPLVTLKAAAGAFSAAQDIEAQEWVEPLGKTKPTEGLFIAQVLGESMNRRIPSGAYCIFGKNRPGSRSGRVVLAQHRTIDDPDNGGQYTVKVFRSSKSPDQDTEWKHDRIWLEPDSDLAKYSAIEIIDPDETTIIAEMIEVLPGVIV